MVLLPTTRLFNQTSKILFSQTEPHVYLFLLEQVLLIFVLIFPHKMELFHEKRYSQLFITSLRQSQQNQMMNREKSKGKLALNRTISLAPDLEQVETVQQEQHGKGQDVHQFILSQFKEKYDQLKSQFESKKREADSLLYDKKKLEIELLNHNVEYYEKEIVRLRDEVEKYQMENQENKHRYFIAENSRKDLEATSKVKQEELKQVLKQLEKEKISVVELRHQLTEKDKNFSAVIEDLGTANKDISLKYDDCHSQLNRLESDLKVKTIELDQTRRELERIKTQTDSSIEEKTKQIEKLKVTEYISNHRIGDLQDELKEIVLKDKEATCKLQARIRELQDKRRSQELLLVQQMDSVQIAKDMRAREVQIAYLQEYIRDLEFQLNEKSNLIGRLEQQLKKASSLDELREAENYYQDLLGKQKQVERNLEARVRDLEKELEMSRIQTNYRGHEDFRGGKHDFQAMLRNQIEENSKLKIELSAKIDEIFALKNALEEQHTKEAMLVNELDIMKKRQKAEEKNSRIGFDIELQNQRNETDTLRRKLEVSEAKLAIKMKEVKDKDTFIGSVVVGRSRQEDVPFVLAELKRVFQTDYVGKLNEATLRIADLQAKLECK